MIHRSNAINSNNDDEKMNPNGVIEEAAEKKDEPKKESLKKGVHKKDTLKFKVLKKQAMKKNILKKDIPNDEIRAS